eukprot:m.88867 g.88867  ORF g.88867 m.88867 type:complete len:141 (-) comp14555_c0_seq1:1706-2128(-)
MNRNGLMFLSAGPLSPSPSPLSSLLALPSPRVLSSPPSPAHLLHLHLCFPPISALLSPIFYLLSFISSLRLPPPFTFIFTSTSPSHLHLRPLISPLTLSSLTTILSVGFTSILPLQHYKCRSVFSTRESPLSTLNNTWAP